MDKTLTKALEGENVKVLKSDNICIGEKMPLPNGMVGIVFEETEKIKNKVED